MIPDGIHVLCGTCVGEYERKSGYFESAVRRRQVGTIAPTRGSDLGDEEEYCCNCGQISYVAATFVQEGNEPCDGRHEEVED